ncbi:unnamed protein product [Linum tenue]|uniref:HSF-type DNA-binding domain-containing protein n=1 Tax=Linum tenue TaxID=586396 RepID=A0AAV0JDT2_9ROSI|nr:unnamed protein product [Linum tenue]
MKPEDVPNSPHGGSIAEAIPIPASPLMEFFEEFPQSFEFKAEPVSDVSSPPVAAVVVGVSPPSLPKPLAILHETPIPPFLSKTFDLVDDRGLDAVISWGADGVSFVVWDPVEFSRTVLPRNFKHNNFSSFVRQLNTYGFRKIDADKWEFANEGFQQGQKHLLRNIQRRKTPSSWKSRLENEVERLRKERGAMMQEVVELQQQQRGSIEHMETVNKRIHVAEQRQKQMLSFLAKLFQNPGFLDRLKESKEGCQRGSIGGGSKRKKFLRQSQGEVSGSSTSIQGKMIKHESDSFPMEEELSPDYVLQNMAEGGADREGSPFVLDSFVSTNDLAVAGQEFITPTEEIEEPFYKGKNVVMDPQPELGPEDFISYPDDLGMQQEDFTLPAVSSPGFESIVKQEVDVWSMGFDTHPAMATSPGNELWEFGVTGGFSDVWDLGSTQAADRSSGFDKQLLVDESLLPDISAAQPQDVGSFKRS